MDINTAIQLSDPQAGDPDAVGFTIDTLQIGRARLRGIKIKDRYGAINFIETVITLLERTMRRRTGNHAMFPADLPYPAPTRLLSQELRLYLDECKRRRLSTSHLRNIQQAARIFLASCEDVPVSQINHEHIVAFWDAMRWWPSTRLLRRELRGMTDQQILAEGRATNTPPPADSTIHYRMRIISTFFEHLKTKRAISHSPCDAVNTKVGGAKRSTVRRSFTDNELTALFDRHTFLHWATLPHLWWIPMIGLFTGARVNEIAQLKVKDVECVHGIWCFHIRITTDDDRIGKGGYGSRQKLKCKSSARIIPIAQPLLDAGLLDFVEDIKRLPHSRLFPHLRHHINPKTDEPDGTGYAPGFSRQFNPYLRQFVPDRYLSFHGFRYLVSSTLQRKGAALPLIAKITGHTLTAEAPTLEKFYIEEEPEEITLKKMSAALSLLSPPVSLPTYTKGQFARTLRDPSKLHP
ncbi:site-specific integrase [Lysobacter enzymogenes]|uniref:site-specific integrase n=1 Tax=Lysobacter enzymogenes TaxID=69 RepID=UPI000897383A|nr:site-specific integrase [Lysobacter enzymogenes]SDW84980.1 Phage integrase family protein [Lysobacter enzymogenes]